MPSITKADLDRGSVRGEPPLRSRPDPGALSRLLSAWMEEDEDEQRATFEFLRRALDENRPPGYKLFP